MPPSVPRTLTPAVEPSTVRDVTEPELAPPTRRTPVPSLPPPPIVRSRKATLVSPIPALLAASMTEIREEGDGTPQPIDIRNEATSRFEATNERALMMADESEYVVELDDVQPAKPGK